ncbi:Maf-like protein [Clostridium hydrogenum]|uniref:Maf-like protein n=1 Tax=Clostridium hydrogenum TaxID=2855764 RepID=UPI001F23A95A|nr:Maf-like protein [Clostridium hydrogenum]
MKLILASSSPRRKELLKKISDNFNVIESDFDEEKIEFSSNVPRYVMTLAEGKARSSLEKIMNEEKYSKLKKSGALIIGCDTVVEIDKSILGKPNNNDEAIMMLKKLSGKKHRVYSGIALVNSLTGEVRSDFACTEVMFSKLSDSEIIKYVNSGESIDKAGAYGIQGKAAVFVEEIQGCYYNIVGLPLNKLYKMIMEMGVNLD